jgi:signal transduction histidine kinase
VAVKLWQDKTAVHLSVKDDGLGFLTNYSDGSHHHLSGLGLLGMKERLELLGGWLDIQSEPGQGTEITAHLPPHID